MSPFGSFFSNGVIFCCYFFHVPLLYLFPTHRAKPADITTLRKKIENNEESASILHTYFTHMLSDFTLQSHARTYDTVRPTKTTKKLLCGSATLT